MTNPAPPGGDERPPPPAYDTGGEPTPAYDALAAEAPLSANPPIESAPPLGTDPLTAPLGGDLPDDDPLTAPLPPVQPPLTPEADYALAPDPTAGGGPLAQVRAFAAEKPAAFVGAALAAGWLLGKITSRRSGD
jgi:hypothetical protein